MLFCIYYKIFEIVWEREVVFEKFGMDYRRIMIVDLLKF